MAVKLRPLDDKVIVKPIEEETKTETGIILPDTVDKEKPEMGEVIAVGPGKLLDNGERAKMTVKVGDKVVFTKYAPNEIKIKEEEFLIIPESDILAIIEE